MMFRSPTPTRFAGHLPLPFVPSGHFPLSGGIGSRKGGGKYPVAEGEAPTWLPPCGGAVTAQAVTEGVSAGRRGRRPLRMVSVVIALLLPLTACAPKMEEYSTTVFAMDTVMNLKVCGEGTEVSGQEGLNIVVEWLYGMEEKLSVTREDSDIHKINAACGKTVEVTDTAARLLEDALGLCDRTGGALDITAYPAVKAWGFTTGEYRVPGQEELAQLAEAIDYTRIGLDGNEVTLPGGMQLDLGAVAKGRAGDTMALGLREMGISSALLDLGQSTIAAIGAKPDGRPWRIGIQDPAGTDYLGVLELVDQSMGSSGNYQRYFEENGVRYGHIIDPDTASPADSGLAGVTVVADSAFLCDGLSTALFVMGREDAADYWAEHRDFEAIFIEENGDITITPGLKEAFTLRDGYTDREVSVLE